MKAIYNSIVKRIWVWGVVCRIKDTKFWKQFTTCLCFHQALRWLFVVSKILSFESNSQLPLVCIGISYVVCRIKDTKFWKQFTTATYLPLLGVVVVCRIKDTKFWKQFTTNPLGIPLIPPLFVVSKILSFESNSQQQYSK